MKMTAEQRQRYLDSKGIRCPHCGSTNLTGHNLEQFDDCAVQPISCDDCGADWQDIYTLTDVEDIDI
jgi:transcription elongation factor Elf1